MPSITLVSLFGNVLDLLTPFVFVSVVMHQTPCLLVHAAPTSNFVSGQNGSGKERSAASHPAGAGCQGVRHQQSQHPKGVHQEGGPRGNHFL